MISKQNHGLSLKIWCPEPESNQRHADFQCFLDRTNPAGSLTDLRRIHWCGKDVVQAVLRKACSSIGNQKVIYIDLHQERSIFTASFVTLIHHFGVLRHSPAPACRTCWAACLMPWLLRFCWTSHHAIPWLRQLLRPTHQPQRPATAS